MRDKKLEDDSDYEAPVHSCSTGSLPTEPRDHITNYFF